MQNTARERLIALAAQACVRAQEAPTTTCRMGLLEAAAQWITVVSLLSVRGVPAKQFVAPALEAADRHATAAGDRALPPAKDEVMALLYG